MYSRIGKGFARLAPHSGKADNWLGSAGECTEAVVGYPKRVVKGFLSLWPFTHLVKRISPHPILRKVFRPLVGEKVLQVTFIPVGEKVPAPQGTVLPRQAVAELIRASSHRFIHDGCICRNQEGCRNYPRELGCIFLGEAAAHLHPSLGHRASVEECLNHLEKAARAGLTGMVGRIWFDAASLGVLRRFRRFLVICFCCDCCCLVRTDMRGASPEFKQSIRKLESVRVRTTERCAGCGTCVETCFVGAVCLHDGRASIVQDLCKGCGRCAQVCPRGAIEVDFDREEALFRELLLRAGRAVGREAVDKVLTGAVQEAESTLGGVEAKGRTGGGRRRREDDRGDRRAS